MTAFASLQLGQHGVGHIDIVTVPCTISDTKGMHVGVLAQILKLVLLVIGVYRYQYGTDFRCGIQESQPVGYVSGPDTYVRALLHANGDKALGQVIDALVERAPRKAEVTVRINDIFLIGRRLGPMLQPLA